ncbi:MAG: TonB-dependent receptor [Bacteroidota bacterium]
MLRFLLLLIFMGLFTLSPAWAQVPAGTADPTASPANSVSGSVTAGDGSGPLPGATVQIENTTRGVTTDFDGNFTLELREGDSVLLVSYIGFVKQRIPVGSTKQFSIVLMPEQKITDEVVVIGYGVQKKSDNTGSVSSVRGDDLVKVPNNNAMQALQGKVAGVQVVSNSGTPGDPPKVRIRGIGSTSTGSSTSASAPGASAGKNDPLYVVDGVFMNDISGINSQDIESMEILKDASAAAIFGIGGANGVILITTKGGTAGQTRVTFNAEYGLQTVNKMIGVLDGPGYATVANNAGWASYNANAVPSTNWQDSVFRTSAPIQNYQLGVSGGSKTSNYYLGVGYFKQDGILPHSDYQRLTTRFNGNYFLGPRIKVGHNISIAPYSRQNTPSSIISNAYYASPIVQPHCDTCLQAFPIKFSPELNVGNPLATLTYESESFNKGVRSTSNIFAELTLPAGFSYRVNAGIDMTYQTSTVYTPVYRVNNLQQFPNSKLTVGRQYYNNLLLDNLLYYKKDFGPHNIDALAGYSVYLDYSDFLNAAANNVLSAPDLWYLNSTGSSTNIAQSNVTNGGFEVHRVSYFGRASYSYKSKYSLTGTYRIDGSSKFGSGNLLGYFPSFGANWLVSEEDFMKKINWINLLKVRGSWGRLGNDKIDPNLQYAKIAGNQGAVLNGTQQTGQTVGNPVNKNLKWETTEQFDAGVEIGLLNNRLRIEADYYNRKNLNMLAEVPIPGYVGAGGSGATGGKIFTNVGSIRNSGIELAASWRETIGKFSYRLGGNLATVKNTIIALNPDLTSGDELIGESINGSPATINKRGGSVGEYYGYKVIGVFKDQADVDASPNTGNQKPGELKYADVSGNGKIGVEDRVSLGSPIPKMTYGFNLGFNFANFDLSADFNGTFGNKIMNGKEIKHFGTTNFESHYANGWSPSNTETSVPAAYLSGSNYLISDFYVYDGSYLRLRTLTLSYTIPEALNKKMNISKLQVYLRGTNLLTWTKWTGYSPEVGGSDMAAGIDYGTYPVTTVYTGGINFNF